MVQAELLLVQPDDVPARERLAELVGHGAEVLADDRRRRPRRLGGDHGQQLLARVAHVRSFGRAHALRYPPQPVHAHHVVDAQHRGVLAGAGDEPPPQRVAAAPAGARQLRREAPVLAVGEELVGRRADGHARRRTGRRGPTSRSRRGGCRSAGRGRAAARPSPSTAASWRSARYWARRWLRSTRAAGAPASAASRCVGAEAGEVDDVGPPGDEAVDAGLDVRVEVAGGVEQLAPPAGGELAPVDAARAARAPAAAGSVASSRYTSFQCSRLTGAYGLGSNGSSRNAAYSGSVDDDVDRRGAAPRWRSAARWANDGSGDRRLPQRVGRDEQRRAAGERRRPRHAPPAARRR